MNNWYLHFMNSRGLLTQYIPRVEQALDAVSERASGIVDDIALDVDVVAINGGGIPETGHVGYSPGHGIIRLVLDPSNENLEHHMGESLERMIAHELHHALRWDTVGYGQTLLDAIVSEGLAGRFAQELYGNVPEMWESALSSSEIVDVAKIATATAVSNKYNHAAWFFGEGDLPRWAGYTLGWELVGNLSGALAGRKPSTLIATKSSEFLYSLEHIAAASDQAKKLERPIEP